VRLTLSVTSATGCIADSATETRIDLGTVDFVLPGGIVAVACAARRAVKLGRRVTIRPPLDGQVARYASRMGLGDILSECGAPGSLPIVRHHDRTDALVECQWVDDDAVGNLAVLLNDRLWDAGVDELVTDTITSAVYEIADNVKVHSGAGGGFICAQTYEAGTARERIEVAVGDSGRGIRASLEERHHVEGDQHALHLATLCVHGW